MIYLNPPDVPEDKALLETLYHTYRKQMFCLARSILHDDMAAEDAVQDVFLRIAARHLPVIRKIACPEDLRNYLLKATKNTALNTLKSKRREQAARISLADTEEISDEAFLERICARAEYDAVVRAIGAMDEIYRDVLYYHFVMELSVSEVAVALERKQSTVKKQLVRGKKLLLEQLEPSKEGSNGY